MSTVPSNTGTSLPADWLSRDTAGRLVAGSHDLEDLARRFGTPLYVYDRQSIERTWQQFTEAVHGRDVDICYAMKANSNLAILELFSRLGAGFDVVSGGELARVIAAGGDPAKVVFSGVGKSVTEMQQALEIGIGCFNVESLPELERLNQVAGECGRRAPVSLRINPDVDAATHPYISTGLKENKFGIAYADAFDAYRRAASLPHIQVQGIDCHIGSQITEAAPFLAALERLLVLIERLESAGIILHHLDLGGGLGIRYQNETPPSADSLMQALFARLDRWRPATGAADLTPTPHRPSPGDPAPAHDSDQSAARRMPRLMFEFGRALVGNAGILLTRLEYLKTQEKRHFAIVDAAMNDLMRPALYQAYHQIEVVDPAQGATLPVDVVGPICESGDWLGKDRRLRLPPNALLAILSAGAYGSAMASNYNSRTRPAEVLIDGDRVHLIRERESIEDLYRRERRLP